MAPPRCAALGAAGTTGCGGAYREAKQRLGPGLQARSALRMPPKLGPARSSGSLGSSIASSSRSSSSSCSCSSSSSCSKCKRCRNPTSSCSSRNSGRMSSSQGASHLGSCAALNRSCQGTRSSRRSRGQGALGASAELAGQYDDNFADVEKRLMDFFTFKAVRVILQEHKKAMEQGEQEEPQAPREQRPQPGGAQSRQRGPSPPSPAAPLAPPSLASRLGTGAREGLGAAAGAGASAAEAQAGAASGASAGGGRSGSSADGPGSPRADAPEAEGPPDDSGGPPSVPYSETRASQDAAWLQDFVVNNKVQDSKLFIRTLVQERQELAERIMVTRLHLYSKWAKRYDHANMHAAIKDQNLELLRERLIQTVRFQAEDSEGTPHE